MSSSFSFGVITQPVVVLGFVGFTPEERASVQEVASGAPIGGMQWVTGEFAAADAWLISGERTELLAEDEVLVQQPSPRQAPVRFWLPEVDRPIAFSRPLASDNFEPAYTFDLDSPTSLRVVLAKFSQWLRPRAMLLCLAGLLAQHAPRLKKSRVYHLMAGYRLVAVVDLKGDIGVLPDATLGEIARATWLPRPDSAAYVPENFSRGSTRELLRDCARRTDRDLLPSRRADLTVPGALPQY